MAEPLMVAEMDETALVFSVRSRAARLGRCPEASGAGEDELGPDRRRAVVGGRWETPATVLADSGREDARHAGEQGVRRGDGDSGRDTQSCTRSDTLGFATRLFIFLLAGLVVMTMTGAEEKGEDGRYV